MDAMKFKIININIHRNFLIHNNCNYFIKYTTDSQFYLYLNRFYLEVNKLSNKITS